jgi:hypothetical protein
MVDELLEITLTPPDAATPQLHIRGTACHSREQTMKQMYALLRRCRGFLLEEHKLTTGQSSLNLEVPRRSIFDLYSGLLAAELDLCHDSHLRLTSLCNLRFYRQLRAGNINLTLEMSFPEEIDLDEPWAALGFA